MWNVSAALGEFISVLNVKCGLAWDIINFIKKEMVFTIKILTEQDI